MEERGPVPTIVLFVALVAATAFLSAWAHTAQRRRGLAIALYVVFAAVSLVLIALGLWIVFSGTLRGYLYFALGAGIGLPLLGPLRRLLSKIMPFDPCSLPDMVGLSILLGIAFFLTASNLVGPAAPVTAVGVTELVSQSITFVLIAYLGVGALINRDISSATERLGLHIPTLRQTLIALLLVFAAFLITASASILMGIFQPELQKQIEQGLLQMTEQVSSLRGAAILGLSAGIGEEILFRGAIQPRYGIIFTSLVFSLFHVQYGFSLVVLGIFGVGVLFGLERQRMNTTTAIITHLVYDTIAVVITSLTR